jgi:hypothetical protein
MELRRRQPIAALIILLGFAALSDSAKAADFLFYLHSDWNVCTPGPDPSATSFTLDSSSPISTDAKCRNSVSSGSGRT